jgi:hypothetical protein
MLNEQILLDLQTANQPFAVEVTGRLAIRNRLTFQMTPSAKRGEVALEIRADAWIEGLKIAFEACGHVPTLHVTGRCCGRSTSPLDAYVIVGRFVVSTMTILPSEEGAGFDWRFTIPEFALPVAANVIVELVQGSMNWYREEYPLETSTL